MPSSPAAYHRLFDEISPSAAFLQAVENILSQKGCQLPAKIVAVHSHQTGMAGTVDVQPLIKLQTPQGHTVGRAILHGVPYFRWQGGTSGLVIDPQKGDIGQLVLNGRDVSGLASQKGEIPPASDRIFDENDCYFLPCLFGSALEQYLLSHEKGWTLHAKENGTICLEAKNIRLEGDVEMKGNVKITGNLSLEGDFRVTGGISGEKDITAMGGKISLTNHIHPVSSAPGVTGNPQ